MDLNLKRRKRELTIADEVAVAFLQGTDATDASPQKLIGVFTSVCEGLAITPDDAAIGQSWLCPEGYQSAQAGPR